MVFMLYKILKCKSGKNEKMVVAKLLLVDNFVNIFLSFNNFIPEFHNVYAP